MACDRMSLDISSAFKQSTKTPRAGYSWGFLFRFGRGSTRNYIITIYNKQVYKKYE